MTADDVIRYLTDAKADGTINGSELLILAEGVANTIVLRETPVDGVGSTAAPPPPFRLIVERRRRAET